MTQDFDYSKTKEELENIISWFEDNGHDLNESFVNYQKAQELITKLEQYLKENRAKLEVISKQVKP